MNQGVFITKRRSLGSAALFIGLMLTVLLGCAEKPAKKERVIGASLLTLQDDFYIVLNKGLMDGGKKSNVKIISRNADFKLSKQIADIEDFLQQKVDLLIISPVSTSAIGPAIEEANKKGIPVVTVDIRSETGRIETHIASDDVGAGKSCTRFIAELLNGHGEVAIITHPVITSCLDRVKAFRKELKNYPGIKIVSEQNAESRREKAMAVMEDVLTSHPEVDCVVGMNDVMTLGAMAAIEGAGRIDEIKAVMVSGGQKETFDRLKAADPCLRAAALVFPYSIGRQAVETAVTILDQGLVPSEILIPVQVITHENAAEVEEVWGKTK